MTFHPEFSLHVDGAGYKTLARILSVAENNPHVLIRVLSDPTPISREESLQMVLQRNMQRLVSNFSVMVNQPRWPLDHCYDVAGFVPFQVPYLMDFLTDIGVANKEIFFDYEALVGKQPHKFFLIDSHQVNFDENTLLYESILSRLPAAVMEIGDDFNGDQLKMRIGRSQKLLERSGFVVCNQYGIQCLRPDFVQNVREGNSDQLKDIFPKVRGLGENDREAIFRTVLACCNE